MRVPTYLVISQWALLLTLGMLVVVVYRQLGRAFHRDRSSAQPGPPIGTPAVPIEYSRVADGTAQRLEPGPDGASLVAFVDPTCPSCERLVASMDAAAEEGGLTGVNVLLLVSDPADYLQISDAFRSTEHEIGQIIVDATVEDYRATVTPLLVGVDRQGIVRASGSVVTAQEVAAFVDSCRAPALSDGLLHVMPGPVNPDPGITSVGHETGRD